MVWLSFICKKSAENIAAKNSSKKIFEKLWKSPLCTSWHINKTKTSAASKFSIVKSVTENLIFQIFPVVAGLGTHWIAVEGILFHWKYSQAQIIGYIIQSSPRN